MPLGVPTASLGAECWFLVRFFSSPQVRLAMLQLKGLEDSYNGRVAFPTGSLSLSPFGFL